MTTPNINTAIASKNTIIQKMPPLHLIYSLFYFFPLLFMPNLAKMPTQWWFAMLAVYSAFIGLALTIDRASTIDRACINKQATKQHVWCLVGIIILATLGAKISVGTSSFFAYMPFYALLYFPIVKALRWITATLIGIFIAAWLTDFAWYFWAPAIGVFILNTVTAFIELKEQQLLKANAQASHLAERERIAHNLHDATGHHLTAIALKAQLAQKLIATEQYSQASDELAAITELAAHHRSAIRRAIEGELPDDVQANYTTLINLLKNQGFDWRCEGILPQFTVQASPQIVAILSEAITNTLRHASQKQVECVHSLNAQGYTMSLINPANHSTLKHGVGINSMQKRAVSLGGQLTFSIQQNRQAQLILSLPNSVLVKPNH